MKYFNKIVVVAATFWILFAIISSYFIYDNGQHEKNKGYRIDINRINALLLDGIKVSDIDLSQYSYVKNINYIELPCTGSEITDFFDGKDIGENFDYHIQPVLNDNKVIGYIRFLYERNDEIDINHIIAIYAVCLAIMTLALAIIIGYVKIFILKPFNEVLEMPYELAKGHLSTGVKESKNRFFGEFLWGLDLLRENLELHKKRQLQLEKEKKTMILSISHDIKTPLSTIKLYSKAIYDNLYDTNKKKFVAAKYIEEKADQIERFVGDIMDTSTNDFLDIQVNSGEFYLSQLINQLNRIYKEKLRLIKTEFSVGDYEDALLMGDIERLIEVFENIIENAIKYGDGKSIKVTFSDEDYCKLITVSNSGTPIPRTEFVHMFESFWRGANAHEKNGSGLGLYICKEILKKMDGDIFAGSSEDLMSFTVVVTYSL